MERRIIKVGPYNHLQEEPEFFKLHVEGEKVVDIEIEIGYNHRGIELIAETKTWDQDTFLVERICGICSTSHPMAYVLAFDDLMQREAPARANYIRTITAELERIHSHLLWLGLAGHFIGFNTLWMWAWKYREPVLDVLEEISGNRQSYAMFQPGGVRRDFPMDKKDMIIAKLKEVEKELMWVAKAAQEDPVLRARLKDVGVLTKEDAIDYCAVGPTARASGVAIDVRKDEPYAAYGELEWDVVVTENGDVFDKTVVRILECLESLKIIYQAIEKMPEGELSYEVEEIPVGEGVGHAEAPRGEVFHYVRSNGSNYPVRHKVRAPSYMNVPTAKATCINQDIADVLITLAAVDPCYCCTERMARVFRDGKEISHKDLLKLSIEKTEKLRTRYKGGRL